jgi:hypothetical protein
LKLKKVGRPRKPTPPPKQRKPRVYTDNVRQYNTTYYAEKMKKINVCEICQKRLTTIAGFEKHQKENMKCRLIKLENIINDNIK